MIDAQTPPDVLATALAAAFPSWEDRAELAREAGLGDVQLTGEGLAVWKDLVQEGAQRGRLEALLRAADARRSGWRSARWMRFAPLAGLVVVLAVVVLVYRATSGPAVEPLAVEDAGTARAPVEALPAQEPNTPGPDGASPALASTPSPTRVQTPSPTAAPNAAPARERAPAPAPPPKPPTPATTPSAAAGLGTVDDPVTPGNCGDRQGWAYLGTTTDVVASNAWTVSRSYNVRTDYPRRETHYAMAPAICVLHPGDVVAIPDGPTKVDGGAFWIHIQGR